MAHILVVDDEERIREVIKKYAQWEGYEVTESVSGEEAVELFDCYGCYDARDGWFFSM